MNEEEKNLIDNFLRKYKLEEIDKELLQTALTHRSFVFECRTPELKDNERLEFLGDAVISAVVAEYLYQHYGRASEGEMSKLRSRLVSRTLLARRGKEMKLGELIKLGKGEEQSGGKNRSSIIGAALEAVVGAIYLSCGMAKVIEFILQHIITPSLSIIESEDYLDYKSRLQELVQKHFHTVPEYQLIGAIGPEHGKTFTVEVRINGKSYGRGEGGRKKIAENLAAKEAYLLLIHQLPQREA